jgi:enoyl-CoA hydratase/carnithine racemase
VKEFTMSAVTAHEAEPASLLVRREGAIGVLTLNRPAQRNALSEALLDALSEAMSQVSDDREIAAVVIAATPPAFCAGHDLREMQAARRGSDRGRAMYERLFRKCSDVMLAIVDCPKPVVAAVEGIAAAAGCQLVASCDLAVAGEKARFGVNGINVGLFCSTPMVALSRNLPRKQTMEMLLTGEMMDAETAERYGLANRVVPEGRALAAAMELAGRIAAQSPLVVKTGKQAFYRQLDMDLADAYAYTARVMTENMLFRDAEEGIGAFIDKRKPQWRSE